MQRNSNKGHIFRNKRKSKSDTWKLKIGKMNYKEHR